VDEEDHVDTAEMTTATTPATLITPGLPHAESRKDITFGLSLLHNPGIWEGSFNDLVRAILVDVLGDGQPLHVIVYVDNDAGTAVTRYEGHALALTGDGPDTRLRFVDGASCKVSMLAALHI
jgi:hypothetical protein